MTQFIRQALISGLVAGIAGSLASAAIAKTPGAQDVSRPATQAVTVDATAGVSPAGVSPKLSTAEPLMSFTHVSAPLRISGEAASQSLTVPVSPREVVQSVMLHLVATNSVSLLAQRSQLAVRMNDRTVAQFALAPQQPELSADIRVPAALLQAGYNRISFDVAQHATNDCEERDAPELWTEIDTTRSTLQVNTALKPLDAAGLMLSGLGDLIDPRQNAPRPLAIISGKHPASDMQLASAGLLAQGIALRLRYLNPVLKLADAQSGKGSGLLPGLDLTPFSGMDVLLEGTQADLAHYLDAPAAARIDGAFLAIYPKPDDPRHFVLVVSGRTDAEVNLAAQVFAHAELPLPNQAALTVTSMPDAQLAYRHDSHMLSGTLPFRFRDLGYRSQTLNPGDSAELKVSLPADVYAPEDAQVQLTLNFSTGAKMRQDSVLNVYLNGQFERTVALDQDQGGVVTNYRMPIALRHFRAGENVITIRPVMIPLVTNRCTLRQSGNLQLSLFDNSTLQLPAVSRLATLPDLSKLASTGFPYVNNGAGDHLAIQLRSTSNDTLAAAWLLLGKMAQTSARPLTGAQLTTGTPAAGRDVMIVGTQSEITPAMLAGAPWNPGRTIQIPVDAARARGARPETIWTRFFGQPGSFAADEHAPASMTLSGDLALSGQLLVMQYRGDAGATTTLLTAGSSADLANGVAKLVEPAYWNNLAGDISVLNFNDTSLWTSQTGPRYEVGHIDPMGRIGYEISSHPLIGYAVIILVLSIMAALTSVLLLRYKRKHHGKTDA